MESLAILVGSIYLGTIAFSLTTVGFAAYFRFKNQFRKTALVLWALLLVVSLLALSLSPSLGAIPGIAGLVATVLIYFRRR